MLNIKYIQGQGILIINVYHPPAYPSDFLTKVLLDLAEMTDDTVIWGDDFNCILNSLIYRFPHGTMAPSPQANVLHAICENLGFDEWRSLHPCNKGYTFFSAPHGCQTRVNYFFQPRTELHSVLSCSIGSIIISDNACVFMDVKLPVET